MRKLFSLSIIHGYLFILLAGVTVILGLISGKYMLAIVFMLLLIFLELAYDIVTGSKGWLIGMVLFLGIVSGIGLIAWFHLPYKLLNILGVLSGTIGICWLLLFGLFALRWKEQMWWATLPAGTMIALCIALMFSSAGVLDFVFYLGIGIGSSLLIWGIGARLFGLIIAGSIVMTVAPGVSFSWQILGITNPITQTGLMLVWFGLGWAIITISSRVISDKFLWWPLIPGGVLEMVGIGLYLGTNPNFAGGFLRNTTLMSVLLFGSYIFFLRLNFRK